MTGFEEINKRLFEDRKEQILENVKGKVNLELLERLENIDKIMPHYKKGDFPITSENLNNILGENNELQEEEILKILEKVFKLNEEYLQSYMGYVNYGLNIFKPHMQEIINFVSKVDVKTGIGKEKYEDLMELTMSLKELKELLNNFESLTE